MSLTYDSNNKCCQANEIITDIMSKKVDKEDNKND